MFRVTAVLLAIFVFVAPEPVSYKGHKVFRVFPKTEEEFDFIHNLHSAYKEIDIWQEHRIPGMPILFRSEPRLVQTVKYTLKNKNIKYEVVFDDLQSVLDAEKATISSRRDDGYFNLGVYNPHDKIYRFIIGLAKNYPSIARIERIGTTYENRPILNLRISSNLSDTKPAIMIECGIHGREWASIAFGVYLVSQLITKYDRDSTVKSLLDKYEFNVIVEANPDGYIYTWNGDRFWRKTRSRTSMRNCWGVDANRNFNVEHCGKGTSRWPCDENFCGDNPFSESEARALSNLMVKLGNRLKAYFSIHTFSQLWMTPFGITKKLPRHYNEMIRVAQAGAKALAWRYGTKFDVGSIANAVYEAAGSSVDYAYLKHNVTMSFALELRDKGRFGFVLPENEILPTCKETFDGIVGAIRALG